MYINNSFFKFLNVFNEQSNILVDNSHFDVDEIDINGDQKL